MDLKHPNNLVRVNDLNPLDFAQDDTSELLVISPAFKADLLSRAVTLATQAASNQTPALDIAAIAAALAALPTAVEFVDMSGMHLSVNLP